jgi:hypothetical protein
MVLQGPALIYLSTDHPLEDTFAAESSEIDMQQ